MSEGGWQRAEGLAHRAWPRAEWAEPFTLKEAAEYLDVAEITRGDG